MSAIAIRAADYKPVLDVIVGHARAAKSGKFDIILREARKDRWLEARGDVRGLEEALVNRLGSAVSVEAVQ